MKNNSKKLFALAAAAALCAPAMAKSDTGFYVAPEIGIVSFSDWCDGVAAGVSCEDSEIGFGIAGGYWFNDLIAAELGARFGSGYERGTVELSYNSFSLGGRVNYPIGTSGLGVTGKAGLHRWSAEAKAKVQPTKWMTLTFMEELVPIMPSPTTFSPKENTLYTNTATNLMTPPMLSPAR